MDAGGLNLESMRRETVQWGSDLVFKIGGKMFAVAATEPAKVCMSFKLSKKAQAELSGSSSGRAANRRS